MIKLSLTALAAGALASAALESIIDRQRRCVRPVIGGMHCQPLKSPGYHVVVNRVGTAPLDQCTMGAVGRAKRTRAPTREFPAPTTMSSPP